MPQLTALATWNRGGDCFMSNQQDIFGHSAVYSETWPVSGSMRNGECCERPMLAPRITAHASSLSHGRKVTVFCTPDTMPDAPNSGSNMTSRPCGLGNQVKTLPTPKASDGILGTPRTTGRPLEKSTHLPTIVKLLPTPNARDGDRGGTDPEKRAATGRQVTLNDAVNHKSIGVCTPQRSDDGSD